MVAAVNNNPKPAADGLEAQLNELAAAAVENNSTPNGAGLAMRAAVEKHADAKKLIDRLIYQGCVSYVIDARYDAKVGLKSAPPQNPTNRSLSIMAEAGKVLAESILDTWPTRYGPLGDCTGEQLMELAQHHKSIANGHLTTGSFYKELAKMAGDKELRNAATVAQVEAVKAKYWKAEEPKAKSDGKGGHAMGEIQARFAPSPSPSNGQHVNGNGKHRANGRAESAMKSSKPLPPIARH